MDLLYIFRPVNKVSCHFCKQKNSKEHKDAIELWTVFLQSRRELLDPEPKEVPTTSNDENQVRPVRLMNGLNCSVTCSKHVIFIITISVGC